MATFTFFELHTPDLERSQAFYGELFNWRFEDIPGEQPRFALSRTEGHRGGLTEDARPHWLNYLTVEDCLASAQKAQRLGGKILSERTEVPGRGCFVVVADPDGVPLALWQEAGQ